MIDSAQLAYTPAELVDMAIDLTYSKQYRDLSNTSHKNALYRYLNMVHKKVYNAILDLDKNYFWDYRVADTQAGQTEYPLEKVLSPNHFGMYKVENIYIKYDHDDVYIFTVAAVTTMPSVGDQYAVNQTVYEVTAVSGDSITCSRVSGNFVPDQYGYLEKVSGSGSNPIPYKSYLCPGVEQFYRFVRLTDRDVRTLKDPNWLAMYHPEDDPIAIISADSVFVYPSPKKPILAGIKFEGAKKIYKLNDTHTSSDIIIPVLFHELLAYGMSQHIFRHQGLLDESAQAKADFDSMLQEGLDRLDTRWTTPVLGRRQDNSNFQ